MKAVLQRTRSAYVTVASEKVGSIGVGWVVLLGVAQSDGPKDANYLAQKILNLRAFPDQQGKMNLSILDLKGEILIVSQFTLLSDCSKGRRPSFKNAAAPEKAKPLYDSFVECMGSSGLKVASGQFQADMQVCLCNDGPVTFILESSESEP
jgi:D-tyrosyl-tRNA(Tyr) deacylase